MVDKAVAAVTPKTPPKHDLASVWEAAGLVAAGPANVRTSAGEVAGQVSIVAGADTSAPPMALIVDTGDQRHLIPWHAVRSVTQIGKASA